MKKSIIGAAALFLGAVTMAFTTEETPARTTTIYQFQGNDDSQMRTLSLWVAVEEEIEGCEVGDLPCYVVTADPISTWLSSRSDAQIVNDAQGKKF